MPITPTDRTLGKSNNYGVVFTDKTDNSTLGKNDFIKLMVAQIQNQDFTKPADASDMLNQMSTLSNMQMMEDMARYSKQSYAMSMVGKYVTATRNTVSGDADMTTGRVDKVAMVDDEFVFYIGDKTYKMSQIYSAEMPPTTEDTSKPEEPHNPDDIPETPEIPSTEKPANSDKTPDMPVTPVDEIPETTKITDPPVPTEVAADDATGQEVLTPTDSSIPTKDTISDENS